MARSSTLETPTPTQGPFLPASAFSSRFRREHPGESINASYLSPYLESLGSDFRGGANFAFSGASTLPPNVPFSLAIQVQQFLRFKSRSMELVAQGTRGLIDSEAFESGLYVFDIGQNALAGAFSRSPSYNHVIRRIPSMVEQIRKAIQNIYEIGGRNFRIHNTGPLGCLPQKLAQPRKDDSSLDENGCLIPYNNASKEFNAKLSTLCDELSLELKNATFVYVDVYAVKYDLIANYREYGFETAFMACCGHGGPPYNYNNDIGCGHPESQVCAIGSKYISWDGVHYTEAANSMVASKIMTAKYSNPTLVFGFFLQHVISYIFFSEMEISSTLSLSLRGVLNLNAKML
ncbi:GDSL esterase/lipase LIP-4-like isoform X2 [Zingiber officinale]|uniref:GDSL esterase/lipase LIP-4-like isoform X2 n=1 Tax=Zingiber officinale TaxID=94328 RepID=UPI001C4AA56E|nr:GDSL esterase/lipase LIP-4-like isoform X2 [Zingiber officinale]